MQNLKLGIVVISAGLVMSGQLCHAFCFEEAAARYNIAPGILKSIAQNESGMNPTAVNYNSNASYDYGLMQINSIHEPSLRKVGVEWSSLSDPCTNVMVGAWLLSRHIREYGYNWKAVGSYHSKTPTKRDGYARKIAGTLSRIQTVAPAPQQGTDTNLVSFASGGH